MILSTIRLIRAFTTKLQEDFISAFAAQTAYFLILSVFPFLMFLLTMLNYLPISAEELLSLAENVFPGEIYNIVHNIVIELVTKASGTLVSITVISAIWSASKGTLTLSKGLNAVYQQKETRNGILLRIISALYTLAFAVLLIVTLVLLVFGNQIYQIVIAKLPILGDLVGLILSFRSLVTMAILTLFFLLLYIALPNRKSNIFRELPGAIITAGGWLGFSFLFSFYIDHMGNFSYTYGSVAALAICMLWLYFCMYILFIGAEINMVLSHPEVVRATHALLSKKEKSEEDSN